MLPLKKFSDAGKKLFEKGKVKEVLFSRGTYQVAVKEKGVFFWPFLQFDEKKELSNAFCNCSTAEKEGVCEHIAAAYLRIYNHTEEPLHIRFQHSLWRALFYNLFLRKASIKKIQPFFTIQGRTEKGKKKLRSILSFHPPETEETSIKFSNLSLEQIAMIKIGKGEANLQFEFSMWSDLAKWFFFLQDAGKGYKVAFIHNKEHVPERIVVTFTEVKGTFLLSKEELSSIILALQTVDSPLPVHVEEEGIKAITFDPVSKEFYIQAEEKKEVATGISIGEWIYVYKKGFYKKGVDPLLSVKMSSETIGDILTRYKQTFKKKLRGALFHTTPVKAKYHLFFDEKSNLHTQCFLFEKGDLLQEGASLFLPWVFLPKKGFFCLEGMFTKEIDEVISKDKVGDFITNNRDLMDQIPGFHPHFTQLPIYLAYTLLEEGLKFFSNLEWKDFGAWLYVPGQGFYPTREGKKEGKLFRVDLVIPKNKIATFIEENKEELLSVKGFFSSKCPLQKAGLAIRVVEKRITLFPQPEYASGYDEKIVDFYGNYSYVEKEGFFELCKALMLPFGYKGKKEILRDQESFFLNYEMERLKPMIVFLDPSLQKPAHLTLKIRKLIREKNFWIADIYYQSEIGIADAADIWKDILNKERYAFSKAGLIFLKQNRFNWLRSLEKSRLHRKYKALKLTTIEWIRLMIFEDIQEPLGDSSEEVHTRKLLRELHSLEPSCLLDIHKLHSTLRPYQELGLNWLWFLYCQGLSGLLCDEMGLGKTHQAMALLAAISAEDKDKEYKYLVVCPTSVIYHWQELLKKFLPHISVYTHYGHSRTLAEFANYDLFLTSYGILRTGKENINEIDFELAIFDEIQIAKNYRSQTHRSLQNVSARMKLGLTGTPIENRLRELKALFDIVLPSYLPSENIFRELFINPIEKKRDVEKKKLLQKLIKPFILRRKKVDVLFDLPEKMEEVAYCDLSEEQQALYSEALSTRRPELIRDLQERGNPIPYIHVFSLFLRLKQICNHPSLVLGNSKEYYNHASGKWELFTELLAEAMDSNQKVVVFSQFLDMLSIIEHYLRKKGVGFAAIKGSTKNRQEELWKFKSDPKCKVFIASLLAAGVGIDLSSASIVIHYDRWWNPAKENQATDRVHRIGQNRGVQVFKLVAKNTIEEHIHALIEKKKGLIEDTIGKEKEDGIRFLSREELLLILQQAK